MNKEYVSQSIDENKSNGNKLTPEQFYELGVRFGCVSNLYPELFYLHDHKLMKKSKINNDIQSDQSVVNLS